MRPDGPRPVEADGLAAGGQFVSDVVTRPAVTALVLAARACGCGTSAGSAMLDAQAELLVGILMGQMPVR